MKLLILLCTVAAVYTAKLEGFESSTTQRLSSPDIPRVDTSSQLRANAPEQLYSAPTHNRFSGASNNLESGFSGSSAQSVPQNGQSFSGLSTQRFPITPSQSSVQQDTTSQFASGVPSETFTNLAIHSNARPSGQSSNGFASPSRRVQPNQSYSDSSRQSSNRFSGTSTQGSSTVSQQYSRPSTQSATAPAQQLLNGVSASLNQDQRTLTTQASPQSGFQSDSQNKNQVFVSGRQTLSQQYTSPSESTSRLPGQNFNQHGLTHTQANQRSEPYQKPITEPVQSIQSFSGPSIQSHPTSNRQSHDILDVPSHQAQNNQPRQSYSAPSTESPRLTGQSFNGISGQTQAESTNFGTSTQTASTARRQSQNNFSGSSQPQSYSTPSAQSFNGISGQNHQTQSTLSGTSTQQASTTRGQAQNNFPVTTQIHSIPSTHASQPSVQEDYSSSDQSVSGFNNQADFDFNGSAHSQNFDNGFHGETINGHSIMADNERNCAEGEVRHVDGSCVVPEVERKVFVYAAPEQELGTRTGPQPEIPLPREEHNIIFIRAPEGGAGGDPIIIPPPQKKHIIYVLNKESENQEQRVIEIPAPASKSPEVFFVNYADGENPTLPGGIDFETALNSAIEAEGQLIGGTDTLSEAQLNRDHFESGNNFNEQNRENAGVINDNGYNNNNNNIINNNNNVAFRNPVGTATNVNVITASGISTNGNNFAGNPANANTGFNRFNAGSVSQTNNGGLSLVVDSGEDFQENAHFVGNSGNPSRNFGSAAVPTPSAPSGFYSAP